MGPICCPETSVKDYHSKLRNMPEEHRSQARTNYTATIDIPNIPHNWNHKKLTRNMLII
jgi:hypothetical protein